MPYPASLNPKPEAIAERRQCFFAITDMTYNHFILLLVEEISL